MLVIKDLVKSYRNFKLVVKSMYVKKGSWIAILGRNGSGKTTLLKSIVGIVLPEEGCIEIDGATVFKASKGRIAVNVPPGKRGVGYVPQNYLLYPHMSVYENIAYALKPLRLSKSELMERVIEVLELVKMSEFKDKYPRELSGGQKQRIALARALALHPKILVLDEPFSNIDPEFRETLRAELKKLLSSMNDFAVVMATNDINDLSIVDKVAVLREGRMTYLSESMEQVKELINKGAVF